ncbi:MAG: PsbP-related protein [archaeon]
MKKVFLVTLIGFSLLLIGCTQTPLIKEYVCPDGSVVNNVEQCKVTEPEINFLTYENADYGIKIKYPEEWGMPPVNFEGHIVTFVTPNIIDEPDVRNPDAVVFQIVTEDLTDRPMTLEEYAENTKSQVNEFQRLQDLKIIDSSQTTLAGNTAHRLIYTYNVENDNAKTALIFTIKNNKVYAINVTGAEEGYSNHSKTTNKMVESFEFI